MKYNVDKLLEIAGNKGKYQYFILLMGFCLWLTFDLISISLPYLEKTRTLNLSINENFYNVSLNYTHCEGNYLNKTIDKSGHSWVIEYDIECDKLKTGLIGSISFSGVLVGSFLFQFIPDMIGRKNTVIIGGVFFSLSLIIFNFAKNIYIIFGMCFISQIIGTLGSLCIFMMSSEITDTESRSFFGAVINSAFSFSGVFFIILYQYYDNWRLSFLIASFLNLLTTFLFYLYSIESPKYFYSKNDNKNLILSVVQIAEFNGKGNSIHTELIKDSEKSENIELENLTDNQLNTVSVPVKNYNFISFFTIQSIRMTFLINCYLWFSTSGIYYGLSIYLKNLPGDIYFNGIFIYTSEVFSYVLSGWIINVPRFGRKGSIFLFETLSFICYLLLLIFNFSDMNSTIISFIARFSISGVYNIIYTYSTEVYPTVLRAKGLGIHSISARLGGIIFPMLIEILGSKVILIFCTLNLWGVVLSLWLPETLGKEVAEEIKD